MRYIHRFGLFILFSFIWINSFSQDNRPVRLEIPVKDDTEIYKVVPCGNNGVMIIYLSAETDKEGNMLWITAMLDRNLMEIWRKFHPLPKGFVLEDALYANNHMVAFFHSPRGSAEYNFRVVDVMTQEALLTEVKYSIPERSGLSHFRICNNFALAGLNNKNDESLLLKFDFKTREVSAISPGINGSFVIESLNIDNETGLISSILRTTGSARKRIYYLVKTTSSGVKQSELALSKFDDNNMINTAFAYNIDANTELVIGSYGKSNRTRVIDGIESIGVASSGFFSVLIRNNQEVSSGFYDFTDFQNFYRYLRRPADLNVRRGAVRADRATSNLSMDQDLLAHEIFRWKNQYVFVAEAYYPEYRTVTTMVYDYYGRPYPSSYSVFEGYRYLTTFIAGFDSTGAMQWNNDLELRNILSQNLKPRVIAWEDTDGLVLSYTNDGKITSKLIDGGTTIDNISNSEIASLSPRDKIYRDSNSSLEFWYNNYFLVYGYQNIRNSYQNDRNNKDIFYINKIAFR